jgi:hypothetical protein
MKLRLHLLLLLSPSLLPADGLSDLRGALQKLQSDQPLRAKVEVQTRRQGGEKDDQKQSQGGGAVIAELGPQGLKLNWSPEQIRQSRQAAREQAADPDADHARLGALTALDADEAASLLDYAEPLKLLLDKAVLQEERAEKYKGKPARLLVLKPDLQMNREERKAVKSTEAVLKIWLDADGLPLAMDQTIAIHASKFFISFNFSGHESREFQRAAGRLVVKSSSKDNSGAGFGHSNESHTTTSVTVLDVEKQ